MLTMHTATSAAAVKKYFELADYFSEGQETVGQWIGGLAERLGLHGKVTKEAFERLCDNLHPFEDRPLTPRTNEERRIGTDMVFAGPKSFSVIEGLAEPEEKRRLLAAFDAAINETLRADIEPDMQARHRKGGADDDRITGNLLAAGYDHSTARPVDGRTPPDPHRHRHVFVFNATFDPAEARIKAAQLGTIVRDRPYFQAAFFARLAHKLEAMGYVIDRKADGSWELAGVPQSVIDKFSKRTAEIENAADALGITDPGRKAELGATTRAKKQKELTPEQLRKVWDAQLTDGERDALAKVYRKEIAPGRSVTAKEAVEYAIAHVSEKLSVAPEREWKRVALLHGLGSLTPERVAAELPRHGMLTGDIDGRRMATTFELQSEEDEIAAFAAKGRGAVQPVGVAGDLSRELADGRSLNDGQWEAARGLLESSNRVNLVIGPAGAGKSSMLGKFDEGMRLAAESVTYLATTAKAAGVLEADGFDAHTLARFLVDEKLQAAACGGRVVVDEAGMLGHKDAVRFFRLAEKLDLKPILVGDPMQHGSVPRGAFLHVLQAYGCVRPYRLTDILRQKEAEDSRYLTAATELAGGNSAAGFDTLDAMGWIRELGGDERYRQIASDYLQALADKKSVLVVSPTHAEAAKITEAIRGELKRAGKIGAAEQEFTRLVPVDATEAERGQAVTYRTGDVLVFHQNAKGFTKGDRLTVADPAAVPLQHAAKFSLYRAETLPLAQGDLVRFTGTVKTLDGKHSLRNGMTKEIAEITPAGNLRLDNGWVVGKDAGHIRHGYVETSFGAQGSTVKRAIVAMSAASLPATSMEQMYVSASRAKERLTLYTDDKEAIRSAIQKSSRKLAALDLPKQGERRDRLKEHRQRRKRLAFHQRLRAGSSDGNRPLLPSRPPTHAERAQARDRSTGHER